MARSKIGGLAWRVGRIREYQQPLNKSRQCFVLGGQHRGLPPTVRVPTQKDVLEGLTDGLAPERFYRVAQSRAVFSGATRKRRPVRPLLAVGKVHAQDAESCVGECCGARDQERSLAV